MFLESLFQKTFQHSSNVYCSARKPKFSVKSEYNFIFDDTYFTVGTNLSEENNKVQLSFNNAKYPNFFVSSSGLKDFSIELYDYDYAAVYNRRNVSLFLKPYQNLPIWYYITYLFDKKNPVLIGEHKICDDFRVSCKFQEDLLSMFYKIDISPRSFIFLGCEFKNSTDWLCGYYPGVQLPLFGSIYKCGFSISKYKPLEFSIEKIKNNSRITYILKNCFDMNSYRFKNYHYLQYKYKNKFVTAAALYDFDDDKIYSRGSLKLSSFLSLHLSSSCKEKLEINSVGFKFHFYENKPIDISSFVNYCLGNLKKNRSNGFDLYESYNPIEL